MTFSSPYSRPRYWQPRMPPVGPESSVRIGRRAASSTEVSPPLACMTSSGSRSPSSQQAPLEVVEVADDLRRDVGVDRGRRRALVLAEHGRDLARSSVTPHAGRALGRAAPRRGARARRWRTTTEAHGDRLDALGEQLVDRRGSTSSSRSSTITSPSTSTRSATPRISSRGMIGSGLLQPRGVHEVALGEAGALGEDLADDDRVLVPAGGDEAGARAGAREHRVRRHASCRGRRGRSREQLAPRQAQALGVDGAPPLSTPSCSDPWVVSDLRDAPPSPSATTQSVNVPPMSTPIR